MQAIKFSALEGHYNGYQGNKHVFRGWGVVGWGGGGGWSKGLIGHISQGLREKVKCQTECCIFLMGHVKPGLFEL